MVDIRRLIVKAGGRGPTIIDAPVSEVLRSRGIVSTPSGFMSVAGGGTQAVQQQRLSAKAGAAAAKAKREAAIKKKREQVSQTIERFNKDVRFVRSLQGQVSSLNQEIDNINASLQRFNISISRAGEVTKDPAAPQTLAIQKKIERVRKLIEIRERVQGNISEFVERKNLGNRLDEIERVSQELRMLTGTVSTVEAGSPLAFEELAPAPAKDVFDPFKRLAERLYGGSGVEEIAGGLAATRTGSPRQVLKGLAFGTTMLGTAPAFVPSDVSAVGFRAGEEALVSKAEEVAGREFRLASPFAGLPPLFGRQFKAEIGRKEFGQLAEFAGSLAFFTFASKQAARETSFLRAEQTFKRFEKQGGFDLAKARPGFFAVEKQVSPNAVGKFLPIPKQSVALLPKPMKVSLRPFSQKPLLEEKAARLNEIEMLQRFRAAARVTAPIEKAPIIKKDPIAPLKGRFKDIEALQKNLALERKPFPKLPTIIKDPFAPQKGRFRDIEILQKRLAMERKPFPKHLAVKKDPLAPSKSRLDLIMEGRRLAALERKAIPFDKLPTFKEDPLAPSQNRLAMIEEFQRMKAATRPKFVPGKKPERVTLKDLQFLVKELPLKKVREGFLKPSGGMQQVRTRARAITVTATRLKPAVARTDLLVPGSYADLARGLTRFGEVPLARPAPKAGFFGEFARPSTRFQEFREVGLGLRKSAIELEFQKLVPRVSALQDFRTQRVSPLFAAKLGMFPELAFRRMEREAERERMQQQGLLLEGFGFRQDARERERLKAAQRQGLGSLEGLAIQEAQATALLPKQGQGFRALEKPLELVLETTLPKVQFFRFPPPPPLPFFEREKRPVSRRKLARKGYDVFLKRRNRFEKQNRQPLHRSTALGLGAFLADETSSASFKVKKARKPATGRRDPLPNLFKFRKPKRKGRQVPSDVFVEKRRYRIDRPGEREQITEVGLAFLKASYFGRGRKRKRRT